MSKRHRYDFDRLDKYCKENCVTLLENYSNVFLTKKYLIKCKCVYENCENEFEKVFCELEKTGAYCKICIKIIANDRRKKTCFEKYGVGSSSQCKEVQEKITKTCLKKYGVKHSFQSEIIKNKIKQANISKYGVSNPTQNNIIKEILKRHV